MPPIFQFTSDLARPLTVDSATATHSWLRPAWSDWITSFAHQVGDWMFVALMAAVVMGTAIVVARQLSTRISSILCQRLDETLGKFIAKLIFYGTLSLAAVLVLPSFGVQLSGVVAILASAAFAIALALQGTLSNISAGMLLLILRPFKVGDLVQLGSITGKVNEIDLFTTSLDTFDNRRLILPNASIVGGTIENISFHPVRRLDITLRTEYSASLDATRATLSEAAASIGDRIVPGERRGYQVLLTNFAESAVEWTVRVWVRQEDFFAVREELLVEVRRALDRNGIRIPFPQLSIHLSPSSSLPSSPDAEGSRQGLARDEIEMITHPNAQHQGVPIRPRAREKSSKI